MREWFAFFSREALGPFTPETDPITFLDKEAAQSLPKAQRGLAMGINDLVEMTSGWSESQVAAVDQRLFAEQLPTLSEVRARFSKTVRSVVRRGQIRNEVEYYAIRNAAELTSGADQLWKLLAEYEERAANGS